jgi:hypothetical protein
MTSDNGTNLSDDQVTSIVKQKHKRPKRSEEYLPHYEKGDMSRMITNAMELANMGPVDMYDPEQVEKRVAACLQYMIDHDMKPTVESMALAFNTNRTQLWRWKEGVESNLPERSRNAIKKGYSIMNQLLSQTMADGKINPVAAIFLLKNNHAYKDQTDVVVTPNNPYQATSDEELKDKYLTDIPADE